MSDNPVFQKLREKAGRTYNFGLGDVVGWSASSSPWSASGRAF
jgi:hypothetical protein